MAPGRPATIDARTLYALAHHFYWELKSIQGEDDPKKGLQRLAIDHEQRARLIRDAEDSSRLTPEEIAKWEQLVDREIQIGNLSPSEKESRLRELKESIEFDRRFAATNSAIELSQKPRRVPAEPKIIEKLLKATSPDQIQRICANAFMILDEKDGLTGEPIQVRRSAWPISGESKLPSALSQYASEFIEAKRDLRYPKSGRPTSQLKQLWFLSRALAGAVHGISTRTAINRIGSVRPDEIVEFSKRPRRPTKTRKKS